MSYYKKFIKTDSFNKVFQVYDLTSKTATLKDNLESVNDDTIIFITDISIGNYIYAKGSLWGDSSNGINWVVLQDDEEFKYSDKMLFQNNLILYDSSIEFAPSDTTKFNTQYIENKVISGNSRIMRFADNLTTIMDSSYDKPLFVCSSTLQVKLYLPNSLTYIGSYAFSSFDNIIVPSNVTQLKEKCFGYTPAFSTTTHTKNITISKLYSSYTSTVFAANCSVRFLNVDEHTFDDNYNVDIMFTRGSSSSKGSTTYTYYVYADDPTLVAQLQNINDEYTIVKVHSLHDWKN